MREREFDSAVPPAQAELGERDRARDFSLAPSAGVSSLLPCRLHSSRRWKECFREVWQIWQTNSQKGCLREWTLEWTRWNAGWQAWRAILCPK
eukprot:2844312-Amphidinium_carterae.1